MEDFVGTAVIAYYNGLFLRITAAHVMNDCPHGYCMPTPTVTGKALPASITNDFRTGEKRFVDADIAVSIIPPEKISQFSNTEVVDLEKVIFPNEYESSDITHIIMGFPAVLQNFPDKLPYLEEEMKDIRKALHSRSELNKDRIKDYIGIHYEKSLYTGNGENIIKGDLGGCSGGAIFSKVRDSNKAYFSGVILRTLTYKKRDILIVGIGVRPIIKVHTARHFFRG